MLILFIRYPVHVKRTPVDCISLGLSGALFAWSKPILVISGINQGSSCGHQMFYSGSVAGAREALVSGVPSLSISLNWKKGESKESDYKDAVGVCLPLINATIRDIQKGVFPKDCSLNIAVPTSPSSNKGFKVTKQSMWRQSPSWQAVSANRHPGAGNFMSDQQSLGAQLAQLGRDASAAGAARRFTTQKKSIVEIESVGVAAKTESRVKKYFRLEFVAKEQEHTDEDLDIKALEDGFKLKPQCQNGSPKPLTLINEKGTPVDCISLGLSGALFAWSKPILVISGINQGSSCGHQMFYSGSVAGAREALISGVPSLSISLNWKKGESKESDFKEAVGVCLPLINATIRDIQKGVFPKDCFLNIEIPTSPSSNKGFKVTKQSTWRQSHSWQAVSANRHPGAGNFMSNQQSLGAQLAQLGRDASAAGAARRFSTQKKSIVEIESVGVAAKTESRVKKYFRLEFVAKEEEPTDEDLDINKALEDGFVSVTPLSLLPKMDSETQAALSEWISKALNSDQ
ncbi:hypothetical protein F2Q68_00046344 [Brassica cretica]|uniref:Survival protein SurE-like phosphatase/nucleotidase domain-containing protein n=1 Tax=Brassica cretica TaxID=69181 RepID=A0A8S9LTC1_BRACR|nr:hypothetical protein F2Q68_00046344 [Brassica cretica]